MLATECYLAKEIGREAMQTLTLSATRENEDIVICACGEIDFSTAYELTDIVERETDDSIFAVVIDLGQVTFIDSEAVKTLMRLRRNLIQQRSIPLYLRNCSKQVTRILSILAVDSIFINCTDFS